QAIKGLIDRMPELADQIDHIGPDVTQSLEAVTDLAHAVRGLPGMGLFVRRGERKDEEDDD
ncbi:MAG: hypothetical protein Q4G46_16780, partial [Propionibacteriaceae bacterium]|nr:hypothetical protein [Propionibacteriaceae bacterium]